MLKKLIKKHSFYPQGIIGILINSVYFTRSGLYKTIKKYSKHMTGTVLDFGCGDQPYKEILTNSKKYIGCDYGKTANIWSDGSKVELSYDWKKINLENEYCDSILCTETMEHIFNIDETLDELHRVLKKGGKMLVTIPFIIAEHGQPHDFARYTSFGIRHLLEKHGFKILEMEKNGSYLTALTEANVIYILSLTRKNKIIHILVKLFIIFPYMLLIYVLDKILPKNKDFYLNNIILCEKI